MEYIEFNYEISSGCEVLCICRDQIPGLVNDMTITFGEELLAGVRRDGDIDLFP